MTDSYEARPDARVAAFLFASVAGLFCSAVAWVCWFGPAAENVAPPYNLPILLISAPLALLCLGSAGTALIRPPWLILEGGTLRHGSGWWLPWSLLPERTIQLEEVIGWEHRPHSPVNWLEKALGRSISSSTLHVIVRRQGGLSSTVHSIPVGSYTLEGEDHALDFVRTSVPSATAAFWREAAVAPGEQASAGPATPAKDRAFRYEVLGVFANLAAAFAGLALFAGCRELLLSGSPEAPKGAMVAGHPLPAHPQQMKEHIQLWLLWWMSSWAGQVVGVASGAWFALMALRSLIYPKRLVMTSDGLRVSCAYWGTSEQVIRFDAVTMVELTANTDYRIALHLRYTKPNLFHGQVIALDSFDCWIIDSMLTTQAWDEIVRVLAVRVLKRISDQSANRLRL